MSGISPPSDPSSSNSRSRSSPEASNPNATRVPAAVTHLVPRRIQLPSSRDAIRVDDSSDTSVEASQQSRFRQRAPYGHNPSNSPDENVPVDLSATQATFIAGAAVSHAHHAAHVADHASNVAIQSQLEAFQARQAIVQQQAGFDQVAAAMRDAATRAILHNQEEAHAALAERDRGSELFEHNLSQQAQQLVLGARHQAQQEVLANQAVMQREAHNLWNLMLDHSNNKSLWVTNNWPLGNLK